MSDLPQHDLSPSSVYKQGEDFSRPFGAFPQEYDVLGLAQNDNLLLCILKHRKKKFLLTQRIKCLADLWNWMYPSWRNK